MIRGGRVTTDATRLSSPRILLPSFYWAQRYSCRFALKDFFYVSRMRRTRVISRKSMQLELFSFHRDFVIWFLSYDNDFKRLQKND